MADRQMLDFMGDLRKLRQLQHDLATRAAIAAGEASRTARQASEDADAAFAQNHDDWARLLDAPHFEPELAAALAGIVSGCDTAASLAAERYRSLAAVADVRTSERFHADARREHADALARDAGRRWRWRRDERAQEELADRVCHARGRR